MRPAVRHRPGASGSRPGARSGELNEAVLARAVRGYARRPVDSLLDRCAASLGSRAQEVPELAGRRHPSGAAAVSARDVREARFPVVLGGYDLGQVDRLLRRLADLLPEVSRPTWEADPVPPAPGPGPTLRTALRGYAKPEVDAFLVRCAHSLRERVAQVPELAPLTGSPRLGEPLVVRDVDGAQFRLVARGYAPDQVDDLLDRVRERLPL